MKHGHWKEVAVSRGLAALHMVFLCSGLIPKKMHVP